MQEALSELSLALSLNPNHPEALRGWAATRLLQARSFLQQGKDPAEELALAEQKLEAAVCINDNDYLAQLALAEVFLLRARVEWWKKRDARLWFIRAKQALKRADALNDKDSAVRIATAHWSQWRAHWALDSGDSAHPFLQVGQDALDAVFAVNPNHWEALALRGVLHLLRAESTSTRTEKDTEARQALHFLGKALRDNQNLTPQYGAYLARARNLLL